MQMKLLFSLFVLGYATANLFGQKFVSVNQDGTYMQITGENGIKIAIVQDKFEQLMGMGMKHYKVMITGPQFMTKVMRVNDQLGADILADLCMKHQGVMDEMTFQHFLTKLHYYVQQGVMDPRVFMVFNILDKEQGMTMIANLDMIMEDKAWNMMDQTRFGGMWNNMMGKTHYGGMYNNMMDKTRFGGMMNMMDKDMPFHMYSQNMIMTPSVWNKILFRNQMMPYTMQRTYGMTGMNKYNMMDNIMMEKELENEIEQEMNNEMLHKNMYGRQMMMTPSVLSRNQMPFTMQRNLGMTGMTGMNKFWMNRMMNQEIENKMNRDMTSEMMFEKNQMLKEQMKHQLESEIEREVEQEMDLNMDKMYMDKMFMNNMYRNNMYNKEDMSNLYDRENMYNRGNMYNKGNMYNMYNKEEMYNKERTPFGKKVFIKKVELGRPTIPESTGYTNQFWNNLRGMTPRENMMYQHTTPYAFNNRAPLVQDNMSMRMMRMPNMMY